MVDSEGWRKLLSSWCCWTESREARGAALQCLYWTRLVVDVGLIANWKGTIRGQMSFENSSLLFTAGRHELSRAEQGWAGLGWAGLGEGRGVSGAR